MPNNQEKINNVKNETSVFKPRNLTLIRCSRTTFRSRELQSTVPTITLEGKWMYEAAFHSGQKVEIIVENQKLLLRVTD